MNMYNAPLLVGLVVLIGMAFLQWRAGNRPEAVVDGGLATLYLLLFLYFLKH